MNRIILRSAFFIGWLLSPLTFWNDAFINIPLSYLLANLCVRLVPINFLLLVLIFYWLTNVAGLAIMYATGADILKEKGQRLKEIAKIVLTMIIYSVILAALGRLGVLKPIF